MNLTKMMFLIFLASVSEIILVTIATSEVKLVAEFNSKRVSGKVSFSHIDSGKVKIFGNLRVQGQYNMSIREFPVKFIGPSTEVCQSLHLGDIFDPRNAMKIAKYGSTCTISNHSACAVGDLAGKYGRLNGIFEKSDDNLYLSGPESIFGRSLTIQNSTGDIIACATIRSVSSVKTVVGIFRAVSPGIAGTIVLRQSGANPSSDTSVDIKLVLVDARSESKNGLFLAVHENAATGDKEGSCSSVGEVFNPLAKTSCDKRQPSTCPIGDLSAKLGPIDVPLPESDSSRSFFIDSNLPLSGKDSVVGRSLMISENGQPLMCTTIQEYQEMEAEVRFNGEQGLNGIIGLKQVSMYEPAVVNMSVSGINGIYEHPLPAGSSCLIEPGDYLWNITGSTQVVDGLTLYGPKSAMFRNLVVNKTRSSKPLCGTVVPKQPTYHLKAMANFTGTGKDAITGYFSLEQVVFNSSKAFAFYSSMLLDLKYEANRTKKTFGHNWHIHILAVGRDHSLKAKKCMSTKGHYNPYNVYVKGNKYASTCNSDALFRCELGDLSGKLGRYTIGSGMKQLSETENYLGSWHNAIGRSVVIHAAEGGASRITCASLVNLQSDVSYRQETLLLKNTSATSILLDYHPLPTRLVQIIKGELNPKIKFVLFERTLKITENKDNFQKTVSQALGIATWCVADVKFTGVDGCLKYSFLLVEDSKSNLHKAFSDLVDNYPDKLEDFAPSCAGTSRNWKISDGKAAEIVSVIFGVIALIIMAISAFFWLRKKHRDEEQNLKLVKAEGGTAGNMPGYSVESDEKPAPVETHPITEIENDDTTAGPERTGSGKGWKVTTSL